MRYFFVGLALVAVAFVSFIAGQNEKGDYISGSQALFDLVKSNKIGSAPDYWIVKLDAFDHLDKVGLIFGYMGDDEACHDFIKLYEMKYPNAKYFCQKAN